MKMNAAAAEKKWIDFIVNNKNNNKSNRGIGYYRSGFIQRERERERERPENDLAGFYGILVFRIYREKIRQKKWEPHD